MNWVMLEDRVMVDPEEAPEKSKGGVFMPDTVREREKPTRGKVLAVGPGRWKEDGSERIPMDVAVGDIVLYGTYAGHDYEEEGRKYKVIGSRDILAKRPRKSH